jgi:hypothetical protein
MWMREGGPLGVKQGVRWGNVLCVGQVYSAGHSEMYV